MKENEDNIKREQSPPHYDVLIISDNPATIRLMTSLFELKNRSSKGVNSGLEALKGMQTSIPRFIIMDRILHDVSGFDFLRKLKSNERLKDIPITFFLEKSQQQDEQKSKRRKEGFGEDLVNYYKF
jgi:CheY-like chemotaxis protein